jgi:hypothetical protein
MTILAGASVFHVWFIVQIVPKPYAYVPNNSGAVVAIRFPNAWFGLESPGMSSSLFLHKIIILGHFQAHMQGSVPTTSSGIPSPWL